MNCINCQENITPYIDDELNEKTKEEVRAHLDICEKCSNFYKSEYALKSFLQRKLNKISAPYDLKQSVKENIQSNFQFKRNIVLKKKIIPFIRPLINYAVAAVLVISIISLLMNKPWQEVNLSKILLPDDFTYVSKNENKITLVGTVICVCCEMRKLGGHPGCNKFGHTYGLKTDNGVLWTFMKNDKGMKVIDHNELIGTRAKVTGWFFFNSNYIDLEELELTSFAQSTFEVFSLNK